MNKNFFWILFAVAIGGCAQTRQSRITVTSHKPDVRKEVDREPKQSWDEQTLADDEMKLTSAESFSDVNPAEADESAAITHNPNRGHGALTLEDLEAMALQCNPTLAQAAAGVDQERGNYRQAGLYPNPQIGYLNTTANQSDPKQSSGMFLSQEIVTASKLDLAQQSSEQAIKRLEWDHEAQRIRIMSDIRIRYYEVLGAQRAMEAAQEVEQLAEKTMATANALLEAKSIPRSELLQARMQLETVRISKDEAAHRYDAAWRQLRTMVGVPELQPVPLAGNLEGQIPDLDEETCWHRLVSESPQLRASESELDQGRAELRSAQAQAIPNVTLQTVTDYDRVTHSTTVSTLVAFPLPVHNRNQGNIDKAQADIRVDQAEISRVKLVLRDQLADSFRRYQTSRTQAERFQAEIVPSSKEALNFTRQAFEAGELSFRDVLQAQQAYTESRLAYFEALTEMHKVVAEIDGLQLTGGLNPAAIGSAIQAQPGGGGQRQRALLEEVKERSAKQLLPAAQIAQ